MTYERKDKKVRAKILADSNEQLLIRASWIASGSDARNFRIVDGRAVNVLNVSREYFKDKYGVSL